jgi:hypothetical protein
MQSENYKRKVDTRDELLARSLDPAAGTNKREDLSNKKCDLRTRITKCTEFDGNLFKRLLRTVTNSSFPCNKFVISTLD